MPERTLVMLKPDAVDHGEWIPQIKQRYTDAGLKIIYENRFRMTYQQAYYFYYEHADKFFFSGLKLAMSSGPSIVLILEGDNVIEQVRKLNGATNPDKAEPGTIRRDFYSAGGPFNTVHGSANQQDFEREYDWFLRWGLIKEPLAA